MKNIFLVLLILVLIAPVLCQEKLFYVKKEWCKLSIEKSGKVLLLYNVTIRVEKGVIEKYVSIGMPCPDFTVISARELETGAKLSYKKIVDRESRAYYVVLYVSKPIYPGEEKTFILYVELNSFIYEDKTNPGNVGLLFIPCWWDSKYFSGIGDLKVEIVLPEGVKKNEFKCSPPYSNIFLEGNRIALYWEKKNLPADYKLSVGVSFPKKYVEHYVSLSEENPLEDILSIAIMLFVIVFVGLIFIVSFAAVFKKEEYVKPALMIEALGPRKGLTAVEAAYLIMKYRRRRDYGRILAMILFGMIKKGYAKVISFDPLRIYVFREKYHLMRSYEKAFADAVQENGEIDPQQLVNVFKTLDRVLRAKMRGYCVKETVEYYESIVQRAWKMVEEAGIPEEKFRALAENLEWLLVDEDFNKKVKRLPKATISYDPYWDTYWWWYWHNLPTSTVRTTPAKEINIFEVADSIASTLEKTASQISSKIEEISEKIAEVVEGENREASRSTDSRSYESIGCVCACVSCACVCACVSCACACASGGAG